MQQSLAPPLTLAWPGERFERIPLDLHAEPAPEPLVGQLERVMGDLRTPTRADLRQLQEAIARGEAGPLVDLSGGLRHHFAPGMYGRELAIPAGNMVVGKIHRHAHLVSLMTGTAVIVTDQGRERITGPATWVSPAGVKRALVTLTDCVFLTVHLNPTDTTDLEVIEADVIVPEGLGYDDEPESDGLADALQRAYA